VSGGQPAMAMLLDLALLVSSLFVYQCWLD